MIFPSTPKSIDFFIGRMIPAYILEELSGGPGDPSLGLFLQYFFRFMGERYTDVDGNITAENAYRIIQNLVSYADIDQTITDLLLLFKKEYATQMPYIGVFDLYGNVSISIRYLVKKVRDFYISKGTRESLQFFFRAIYGQEIELYYPTVDMLRVSDGRWFQPYYLGATYSGPAPGVNSGTLGAPLSDADLANLPDRYIIGQTSGARAYILEIAFEFVPNQVNTPVGESWISLISRDKDFVEGELIKVYDSVTNFLLYVLKLRTKGYETLSSGYPTQQPPWRYKGAWINNHAYSIGDVVYVQAANLDNTSLAGYWVAAENFTSISYPFWQVGQSYLVSSHVKDTSGAIYKVKDSRRTYLSETHPDLDPNNWQVMAIVPSSDVTPAWVSGTTYNDLSIVSYVAGDSIKRTYQLTYTRVTFSSNQDPTVDATNWVVTAETFDTVVSPYSNWTSGAPYQQASIVLDQGSLFITNPYRQGYIDFLPPPEDANWQHIGVGSSGDTQWIPGFPYNSGNQVTYRDRQTLVYTQYKLTRIMPSVFGTSIHPGLDTYNWSPYSGTNYNFDEEIDYVHKWTALPSPSVNPERIGVSTEFPGRWTTTDGFLDSEKKIQDSFFYQDFSYRISANVDFNVFKNPLITNIHPAGFVVFNVVASVDIPLPVIGPAGILIASFDLGQTVFGRGLNYNQDTYARTKILDYRGLQPWFSGNYYATGDLVFFKNGPSSDPTIGYSIYQVKTGVGTSYNGSDYILSTTEPYLDTTDWSDVTTTQKPITVFDVTLADEVVTLTQNATIIWTLEDDYSTFEFNKVSLPYMSSSLDYFQIQDFAVNSGSNNVLIFNNGLKVPSVSLYDKILPGNMV